MFVGIEVNDDEEISLVKEVVILISGADVEAFEWRKIEVSAVTPWVALDPETISVVWGSSIVFVTSTVDVDGDNSFKLVPLSTDAGPESSSFIMAVTVASRGALLLPSGSCHISHFHSSICVKP